MTIVIPIAIDVTHEGTSVTTYHIRVDAEDYKDFMRRREILFNQVKEKFSEYKGPPYLFTVRETDWNGK